MLQKYAFSVSSCKDFELLESADSLSWAKIKAVFSHWNSNDKWWRNLQRNWSFSHVEILNASWFNSYYYCHMILVLLQSLGIASNYFNSSRLRGNCFGSSEVEKKNLNKVFFAVLSQWCSKGEIQKMLLQTHNMLHITETL